MLTARFERLLLSLLLNANSCQLCLNKDKKDKKSSFLLAITVIKMLIVHAIPPTYMCCIGACGIKHFQFLILRSKGYLYF